MTMNANNEMDLLGWDDEVEEGSPFVLLPAGNYPFTVTNVERGIYEPPAGRDSKIPNNCPKAVVTCQFTTETGETTTLTENFFLYKKMQWKINQFFTSIGAQKSADGKVKMNWGAVFGATGNAKVIINSYKDTKTGEDRQNNRIDTFNEPTQQAAATGYQPPQQPVAKQQQPVTPFPGASQPQTPPAGGYNFGG